MLACRARSAAPSERGLSGGSLSTSVTAAPRTWKNRQRASARPGYGEGNGECRDAERDREGEQATAAPAAGEARADRPRERRSGWYVEVRREVAQLELELGHRSSSCSRESARCVLDLTVPRAIPSAAAVSSSERSRK